MKKSMLAAVVLMAVGIVVGGCNLTGKTETPEQVAKKLVVQQLAGLKADCAGLGAVVETQDEATAVVKVSGTVAIDQTVSLVKQEGRWVVAQEAGKK